jgi:hypothetical protein
MTYLNVSFACVFCMCLPAILGSHESHNGLYLVMLMIMTLKLWLSNSISAIWVNRQTLLDLCGVEVQTQDFIHFVETFCQCSYNPCKPQPHFHMYLISAKFLRPTGDTKTIKGFGLLNLICLCVYFSPLSILNWVVCIYLNYQVHSH